MQNLKIRVNGADESKEVQELFFKLGGSWAGYKNIQTWADIRHLYLEKDCIKFGGDSEYFEKCTELKEITLPQLRAMVNPMKEYLVKNIHGEYVVVDHHSGFDVSELIEIPEGAIRARFYPNDPDALEFEGGFCQWWHDKDNEWINYENYSNTLEHSRVVWQREQDEPFLTPETTLNDQYAEIEQVRQVEIHGTIKAEPDFNFGAAEASGGAKDNVNHPSHYADSAIECIDAMEAMMTPEQFIGYLRGNLFKYQWRYEKKNGIEDLKKAQWYLEKLTVKIAEKNAPF